MPVIEVSRPVKSDTSYAFEYTLSPNPSYPHELSEFEKNRVNVQPLEALAVHRFGFKSVNFRIQHHELWDSIYPLMFLTRMGGPLFGAHERAEVRFAYPISGAVRDFYVRRAWSFGIALTIEAATTPIAFDCVPEGHFVAFGGGKDSRLLLGVLQETGTNPVPVAAGAIYAKDLPEARITKGLSYAESLKLTLVDRIMPALMSLGAHYYFGACLADCIQHMPWQQHYDMAAPEAIADFENLLHSLGLPMRIHAPSAMLPSNVVQHILCKRYPQLYQHQHSVEKEANNDKNLHVALCELHHEISFTHHCSEGLFKDLALRFIQRSLVRPSESGYRSHRKGVDLEMRAIFARHRDHPLFAEFARRIPLNWDSDWIDYIHREKAINAPPEFHQIFSKYAPTIELGAVDIHDSPFAR